VGAQFDIVVVGGGHAGIEACLAGARIGCNTALLTMDPMAIGRMSCNPAIGGSAKGHLVREIDALGGEMGKIADATGIHFRMLNKSKGPAVWSPRSQNDRDWYSAEARKRVEAQIGITIIPSSLSDILVERGEISGVVTREGDLIPCRALVLCGGTFLNGIMHTGTEKTVGGRFGEKASHGITEKLIRLGFTTGRLKTGTPPRLSLKTIHLEETEEQPGDDPPLPFSFQSRGILNRQIPMYLTHTNPETHEVLKEGFDRSPMFTGRIQGVGPRYCPSIEDKINRFAGRERHQIFLEPEGYETDIVYMNGFSTSLPADIQQRALRTIGSLRSAEMLRPGYAVEYDYFPPYQLDQTLQTKLVKGLFFAGQINGTSGYEEAAGQGLIAGINAAHHVKGKEQFVLHRSEAYIGVMIDDLINKGTEEPYRVFTSRAEYRLLLRQDNADSRLMRKGEKLGLIPSSAIQRLDEKEKKIERGKSYLAAERVTPGEINELLLTRGSDPISESELLGQILKRSEVVLRDLLLLNRISSSPEMHELGDDSESRDAVQFEVKYEGYLKRQAEQIRLFEKSEQMPLPEEFDFLAVKSLSTEGRERLQRVRPRSIGQASRISGVTPADISILMISVAAKGGPSH
jgi:tRNA uridine 5-carboxymethylaminomethyl modification enzyme